MPVTNLSFIQQEMIRYGMTIYFAFGILGNICNCIMFTRPTYRRTPSSIYFLSLSIFAIIYLIWLMFPLLYALDHIELQIQSLFYCKVRLYIGHILGQCVRFVVVFACIDRYIVTQTNVHIRLFSSVQMAVKLIFITCVISSVIAIHIPILMTIKGSVCGMFGLYKLIYAICQITLVGLLPPIFMSIFSILTIRGLYHRHGARILARQRDRYLMRMLIAEVIINIVTSIPYSINLIYGAVTYYIPDKSTQRLEMESFITFVTQFLLYLISVVPFYLFIATSKPFRNEFVTLFCRCWFQNRFGCARVGPTNEQNTTHR